ncbi:MAG: OadG family protein [Synergistaceae bacterium]|jgi:hypothetical protein|nr:OadG family protein [Synergistaceae bacterium]
MGNISSNFVSIWDGLVMSLIAFSIVFLVTAGLMFVMMALKYFAKLADGDKSGGLKEESVPAGSPAAIPAAPRDVSGGSAKFEGDSELAAVITAAIAAMSGGVARVIGYSTVQADKTQQAIPAWRMTGIIDNSRAPRG